MAVTMVGTREAKQRISALWPTRGKLCTSTDRGSQDALGTSQESRDTWTWASPSPLHEGPPLCSGLGIPPPLSAFLEYCLYDLCHLKFTFGEVFLPLLRVHCSTPPHVEPEGEKFLLLLVFAATNLWSSVLIGSD